MPDSFQPLIPAGSPPGQGEPGLPLQVLSGDAGAKPFRPLALPASGESPSAPPRAAGSCQPVITVRREGDRVASIRIECVCGQVMDLACVY